MLFKVDDAFVYDKGNGLACTCKEYIFNKNCKHIEKVKKMRSL
ncbi:MAG: SWIM zinc finger family protein [Thermoplasmatales archaeon]|nr:SWIM zinc finger family protein [Thermoplasmatales archaeon]